MEYGDGLIHESEDGTCTISFRNQWIVGVYANSEAAKLAVNQVAVGDEDRITEMWNAKVKPAVITEDELRWH